MDAEPTAETRVGTVIDGRFELVSLLGAGAMGQVYLAEHRALQRRVALKLLHKGSGSTPELAERFRREARAASRIDHPSTVRVLDFGQDPQGQLYLAMELLSGRELSRVLAEEGRLPASRAVEIGAQVLAALAAAHKQGVVHRDLKPANIMLVREQPGEPERVKVCDFGIAKLLHQGGGEELTAPALTAQGAVLGTPRYMSPEQAEGRPLDGRSDLFSWGAVMYEMLSGAPAFCGATVVEVLLEVLSGEPVPLLERVPGLDPELARLVQRALAKEPRERYASAAVALGALRGGQAPRPVAQRRRSSSAPRPWRLRPVLGAVLLLGSALIGARLAPELLRARSDSTDPWARRGAALMITEPTAGELSGWRADMDLEARTGMRFQPEARWPTGTWRGALSSEVYGGAWPFRLELQRVEAGRARGLLRWTSTGVLCSVQGVVEGNSALLWEEQILERPGQRSHGLREPILLLMQGSRLAGLAGARADALSAHRE